MISNYEEFKTYFKTRKGLDLNCYKQSQMQRRIEQFISNKGLKDYNSLKESLDINPALMSAFMNHLTINVSQFFRDPRQWDILKDKIIPILLNNKSSLKIWSAGCSAGQEVYTLAITMQEYFPRVSYTIMGNDIDEPILAQARDGFYKSSDLQGVSPAIVSKYFDSVNEGYRVKASSKSNVRFQNMNLLSGTFDSGFDLICCRNVIIYFTEETKNTLYKQFSKALRPGGVLFAGSTEQIFNLTELGFKSIYPFFYQKL